MNTANGIVVLVDPMMMRRACLEAVLGPWAMGLKLRLIVMAAPEVQRPDDVKMVRLVIVNLGGAGVDSAESEDLLATVRDTYSTPVAVLSERTDLQDAIAAAEHGFQGFLPATLSLEIVKQALAFIIDGGTYFPRDALLGSATINGSHSDSVNHTKLMATGLTHRQHEVLEHLRRGETNKHIARELNMQEGTVKVHVRQIMRKLGATNRTQAALLAQSDFENSPPQRMINVLNGRLRRSTAH